MLLYILLIVSGLTLLCVGMMCGLLYKRKPADNARELVQIETQIQSLQTNLQAVQVNLSNIERNLKDDFKRNREELHLALSQSFKGFQEISEKQQAAFNALQKEKMGQLEKTQSDLVQRTEAQLETIRVTVSEKLEKTLSERLGQSFDTVGKQLVEVQKGLGEMQTLAQDVGGLKKVLSNVKMRGGLGEIQLGMLLEQVLAPDQYAANVKTKASGGEVVEFAVKLPGRNEEDKPVWLPVDAKFPKDIYDQLLSAYDAGEPAQVETAQRNLDLTIKKMAKDISEKYLDPPNTTDFGILFLPFEGIYAEVIRRTSLLEELQRNHKILITGPTTLAAILNSLQMGFRTLAIQKRSSEVWKVLAAVKKEFENFGGLVGKARRNIQIGLSQLDEVEGTRTRAIQRQLRGVESLQGPESPLLFAAADAEQEFEDEEV